MRVDGPVLFLDERLDFAFALDDQAQGDGLHAASGEAAAHLVPQQRRNLVADQTVEDTRRVCCASTRLVSMSRGCRTPPARHAW
jgi:hypothetical protein